MMKKMTAKILCVILAGCVSTGVWAQASTSGDDSDNAIDLIPSKWYEFPADTKNPRPFSSKDVDFVGPNRQLPTGGPPRRRRSYGSYTIYPLAGFDIAGVVRDPGTPGGFKAGTHTVTGTLLALSYGLETSVDSRYRLELGGFLFKAHREDEGDLIQLEARIMSDKNFGGQLAYLSGTKAGTDHAWTLHGLFRVNPALVNAGTTRNWEMNFGLGAMFNSSDQLDNFPGGGSSRDLSTVNVSTFLNASWTLDKSTSMSAFFWHFRDRNQSVSRFSVGLAYKF